jgi:hypothetical protein
MKMPLVATIFAVIFTACSSTKLNTNTAIEKINEIAFLDTAVIPYNFSFENTTVGGLSGIDYDKKNNQYFLISDDRSAINPARFYTLQIPITNNSLDSVLFTGVSFLKQENFKLYPSIKQDSTKTPDPEAIRFNPTNNTIVWTSEGERVLKNKNQILINPAITIVDTKGQFENEYNLPKQLKMQAIEKGPRRNGVLESVAFNNTFKKLYTAVEEPIYEDGPNATTSPNGAYCRIFQYDVAKKNNVAQYVYELDAVAHNPTPANAYSVNGIVDILWLNEKEMLVMERSFSTGRLPCTIKIYIANFSNATNVMDNDGLAENKNFKPVTKQLLFNFDNLGFYIDNVEGMTFGPTLPNGNKTLLCISDNNFSPLQKSQLFLFEVK